MTDSPKLIGHWANQAIVFFCTFSVCCTIFYSFIEFIVIQPLAALGFTTSFPRAITKDVFTLPKSYIQFYINLDAFKPN